MDLITKIAITCVAAATLTACDNDDGIEIDEFTIPEGYSLSAGVSTVCLSSSYAFDTQAKWLSGKYINRFNNGDNLYDNPLASSQSQGGLGPVYAGYSCGSCHRNAGRTEPTLWSAGGSGNYGFSSMLIYITRKNGAFFQDYGRVVHDQAIIGVEPEGKLKVTYDYQDFEFPDGEKYQLAKPNYTITEWYADSIAPEDLFCTVRIPLRHVGMGLMMAIDRTEIEQLAARSNYPEYGISGKANYIKERGKLQLGLSGNKAQHADLTVELGFSSDMGATNSRFPEEICEGQAQMAQATSAMGITYHQLDVTSQQMEDVDLYMQCLGVPARRNVNDPTVKRGEEMFYAAGCHLCHVTTLHTQPQGSVLLNGTRIPWLGGQT
ncbi:MAG: thiol oxidoreductase, partial [Bacteroidales bacterium]|nr:thiol oxidoreductase [Bacteroidales bacterium]